MTGRPGARREVALGAVAVSTLLAVGTVGYTLIEGWEPMESLYMTVITLTTIGFEEVHPMGEGGRLFTIALALVGIGTFATIATRTVQILITSDALRQRAMQRRLDALSGHYVIAGYGRLGQRVARDLAAAGREVAVVDQRDDRAVQLRQEGVPFVQDNAEEEEALRLAGVERAAGLVLVLPHDAANVFVALTAREIMQGRDLFIVARTNEETSINKLRRAGADKVVSPLEIGADRIAQTILRPRVDRFIEKVLGVGTLDFDLEEVVIQQGSLFDGQSLVQVGFRQRFQAIVVGVLQSATGEWRFNPDARLAMAAGDTLIVLGSQEQLERVRSEGASTSGPR